MANITLGQEEAQMIAAQVVQMLKASSQGSEEEKDIPDFVKKFRGYLIDGRENWKPEAVLSEYHDILGKRTDPLIGTLNRVNQKFDIVSELDKIVILSELFIYPKNFCFGYKDARDAIRERFIYSQNFDMQKNLLKNTEESIKFYQGMQGLDLKNYKKLNERMASIEERLALAENFIRPQSRQAYRAQVQARGLYP